MVVLRSTITGAGVVVVLSITGLMGTTKFSMEPPDTAFFVSLLVFKSSQNVRLVVPIVLCSESFLNFSTCLLRACGSSNVSSLSVFSIRLICETI